MCASCKLLIILTQRIQYIQWVQESKISLIQDTLSAPHESRKKATEEALAAKRWNVSLFPSSLR